VEILRASQGRRSGAAKLVGMSHRYEFAPRSRRRTAAIALSAVLALPVSVGTLVFVHRQENCTRFADCRGD